MKASLLRLLGTSLLASSLVVLAGSALAGSDNDGLPDALDPCPSDPRNLCVGSVAIDRATELPIRLNANASSAECSGPKTDCRGDLWVADFGYSSPLKSSACNIDGGGENCVITGISAIFGCEDEETEDLFQCEHNDPVAAPELSYSFDVPNGRYLVNLFFANTFDGTATPASRLFDISVEGKLAYAGFDQVAAAGASAAASVRSIDTAVTDGDGLQIEFAHVIENPTVKAIEVLRFGCSSAAECDDGNVCTDDACVAGQCLSAANAASCNDGLACTSGDVCAGGVCAGQDACPAGTRCSQATGVCAGIAEIEFGKSFLVGVTLKSPTSLQFGPDDRLYVSQQDGLIKVFEIERTAPNQYEVVASQTITLVQAIPNHDDNGTLNPALTTRQVTGILVSGTAASPVVYVTSSDPRIGAGPSGTDKNLDTNSGVLSRLTWNGIAWTKLDLVRGLPRSEENHSSNGLALDPATNTLYLVQGGHTNMGAPSNNLAFLPEYALSGAILAIDLEAIGEATYDLPTLDDEDRPGAADTGDPFGGNDGKNQAVIVPGGPVQVYSPGYRNAYDLVVTQAGRMYTIDNGPNVNWGGVPAGEGAAGCTNAVVEAGLDLNDGLHHVSGPGYYAGHANPTRANAANTFNASNPQSPIASENPLECDYRAPGTEDGALYTFTESTNGLDEYTADNFLGGLRGSLLAAGFQYNKIYRIELNETGTNATAVTTLFANVDFKPLDVTAQGDEQIFPGSVWVADWLSGHIVVFEPTDTLSCSVASDCDDDDPCTDDFCTAGACQHGLNTAPCNDGVTCTSGDVCSQGVCAGQDACPPGQSCDVVSDVCKSEINAIINTTLDEDFHIPGTQVEEALPEVFETSSACNGCHGPYDVDNDPYATWSGSIKAHAGRDPLFRAQMTSANQDVANVGYFCIRCHMPMSIVTGHADITDGSVIDDVDLDGINCHFCHTMVDPLYKPGVSPIEDLGVMAAHDDVPEFYGNAMFLLDLTGLRRGPYADADAQHAFLPSPFHRTGEFCGTCHDIGNVAISKQPDGTYRYNEIGVESPSHDPHELFPIQRTYSEWKLSAFANGGVDMDGRFGGVGSPVVETCQDCHMPKAVAAGCVFSDPRPDLAQHTFAGASAPVLDLIAEHYKDDPAVDQLALARGRAAAVSMLERAATLELGQSGDFLDVRVVNETGHKLPTGHSEGRRVWLNVQFFDGNGALVAEHGHYDSAQAELDTGSTVVFEMLMGLSDYASLVTGLPAGVSGRMALTDTIVKDNRIPPRGFDNDAFEAAGAPVIGEFYADGQHWHDSQFEVPDSAVRAEVALYYQSTPREYIEALRDENYTNHWGDTLYALWQATGRGAPIAMQTGSLELAPPCASDTDCEDNAPCTEDACVAGRCAWSLRTGPCSDGNLCTVGDICQDGDCVGTAVDCSASADDCNLGVCDPATGQCAASPVADGTSCEDGLFCTLTDLCVSGTCVGAGDPCIGQPECQTVCSEADDSCRSPAGDPCSDDGNPCTHDRCDGSGNCVHPPNRAPCDDDVFCNGADRCNAGTCSAHAGEPCYPGESCLEATAECVGQPCVELTAPREIRCAVGRECTVPLTIETSGYDVAIVTATLETEIAHICSPRVEMGAGGANAQCSVTPETCALVAADVAPLTDVLTAGELLRAGVRCEESGSADLCVGAETSALLGSVGVPLPTCDTSCASLTCGACVPGDCNGDGLVEESDVRCALLCAAGTPPAGADCSCAADCNCVAGTEVSDVLCTRLRAGAGLTEDPCVGAPSATTSGDFGLKVGTLRTLRNGRRRWANLRMLGAGAESVAALRTALWTDGGLIKVRLARRLRKAGYTLTRVRSGDDRAILLFTPPADESRIGEGRIGRAVVTTSATAVTINSSQFGGTDGLPTTPSP